MKIYLAYKHIDGKWGGANNFQRTLCTYLEKTGNVKFVESYRDADIAFFNQLGRGPGSKNRGMHSLSDIKKAKRSGAKIAIRAVNLFSVAYKDNFIHRLFDYQIMRALSLADIVVFQSRYQWDMFKSKGYNKENGIIIHNGADPEIFKLCARSIPEDTINLVSASAATRATKRHDIIAAISEVQGVAVSHVGLWPEGLDSKNVKLIGKIDHNQLAELYRECHGFLHPAEIDPCPNALIEALLSGLPAIYNDAPGSSRELVGDCGIALNIDNPAETIVQFRRQYQCLLAAVEKSREYYSVDRAMKDYMSVFDALLSNN